MTTQERIDQRRKQHLANLQTQVSTEFGEQISAPEPSYLIPESGDRVLMGKRFTAEEIERQDQRAEIEKQLAADQARVDSIRSANAAEWGQAQREREGQMNFRTSHVVARPTAKMEADASARQIERGRKSLATYTEQDAAQNSAKSRERGFFSQLGGGLTNVTSEDLIDAVAMGGASIETDTYTAMVLEKASKGEQLTGTEQSLLSAWQTAQSADQYVASRGGATTGYSIGAAGLPMASIIAETFGTSGAGLLQKGLKLGVGGAVKASVTAGAKTARREIGKGLGKAAAFEAIRTPLRGSLYKNIGERVGGQYSVDEAGAVTKEEVSPWEIGYKAYMQTFIEALTEQGGNIAGRNILGSAAKYLSPKIFGKQIGGSIVAGVDRFSTSTKKFWDVLQKTTNYNGTIDEYLEEQASNLFEPIFTGELERLEENFSFKNQLVTLGSVAMVGSAAQVASAPNIVQVEIADGNIRKKANQAIASIEDVTLRQQVADALKKGQTIEQKADALSSINWQGVAAKDAAAVADAFDLNIQREVYKSAAVEQQTQNAASAKVADASTKFAMYRNKDTGLVHELTTTDGHYYTLLSGSIEDKGADDMLFVRDVATGKTEQMASGSFVDERQISYGEIMESLTSEMTDQITEQTLQQQEQEDAQDAAEAGVNPATYSADEIVELSDGRPAQFIGYSQDMRGAEVAIENEQTGELQAITIPKEQIVGLAVAVESTASEQMPPQQEVEPVVEVTESQQEQTPPIPLKKDGTPDYNKMDGEMFFDQYSSETSKEEALAEIAEVVAIGKKQVETLRKSQSDDLNKRVENRRKIAMLEDRIADFDGVLTRNEYTTNAVDQVATQEVTTPKQYKTIGEELNAMNGVDYRSVEDYILRDIARGVKFRWADTKTSRGLGAMLGLKQSERERRTRIGIIAADGYGIEQYAEQIWGEIDSRAIPHNGINDDTDVRDRVIDVLQRVYSRGSAIKELREMHSADSQVAESKEAQWGEDQMMEQKQLADADYFASLEKPTTEEMRVKVDQLNAINGAKVEVIDSEVGLPSELEGAFSPEYHNYGISYNGRSYINAQQMSSGKEVESTYLHETIGHQLFDAKISADDRLLLYTQILKSISLDQMIEQIPTFAEVAEQYQEGHCLEVEVAREYVAYLAQTHLTTADLSQRESAQNIVVDIDAGIDEQKITELLKQLSNGLQSVKITTRRGSGQSNRNAVYSAYRARNFRGRLSDTARQTTENSGVGDASQRDTRIDAERELQSSVQAGGAEVRNEGLQATGELNVEASQRVASRDGVDQKSLDDGEITSSELRFSEVEKSETDAIKIEAIERGDFMRAPNGEPTNLTEQQWLQVRTRAFKEWFGDWENDKKNASKVVDVNGEPLVVYHGSGYDFTGFNVEKIGQNGTREGQGIYFTQKKSVAEVYVANGVDVYEVFVCIKKGLNTQKKSISKSQLRKFIKHLELKNCVVLSNYGDVDFEGYNTILTRAANEIYEYSDSDVEIIGGMINSTGNYLGVHQALSESLGYDGIIEINPDWGGENNTIFIAAQPSQIKSAVSNNGDFSRMSDDIRFSEIVSKAERIEKLRKAESVVINSNEDQLRRDRTETQKWMQDNLKGRYVVEDTGDNIILSRFGIKKTTSHSMGNEAHIKSLYAIPQLIAKAIFIEERPKEKENAKFDSFRYYVCGVKIDGVDYTAKITVGIKGDKRFYDHTLTQIEKSALIDNIDELKSPFEINKSTSDGFKSKEGEPLPSYTKGKDTKLISILQDNNNELPEDQLKYRQKQSNVTKAKRIEKLRKAESVKITGEEIEHSDDLKQYKRNALEYGKTLRGQYTNLDTKRKIVLNRESLTEILHHDYKDVEHLQSIAAIPQIIEQAIFIGEEKSDGNKKIDSVEYYASGLSVKGVDYTVKSVISISENGTRYYDHKLTKIEKSKLINLTSALSSTVSEENNSLLSEVKDKRLISILQDKSERNDGELPQSQLKYRDNDSKQNQKTTETVEQRLQKLTAEFGVESVSVATKSDLPASIRNRSIGRRFKGAYDPTTGKVYFVMDEMRSVSDAEATFMHEVVAHKGIAGLLGKERARGFYSAVFDSQNEATQSALLKKHNGDKVKAGDEFVAQIAEGNISPGSLQRAVGAVRKFLRDLLGFDLKISDGDIRYMLFLSKVSLQRAANLSEAMHAIEADAMARRQIELAELRMRDRAPLDEINERFNEELDGLLGGSSKQGHIFSLGLPSEALLSGGVPNLPIELEADRLRRKANQKEHPFDLALAKNLPEAIAHPIAVFNSKNDEGRKVIFTQINDGAMNFVVVVEAEASVQRGREVLTVNDVRSIYPKESGRVVRWINEGLVAWVDKGKASQFIERQSVEREKSGDTSAARLDKMSGERRSNYAEVTSPDGYDPARSREDEFSDAAKIVENFENPKNELRFSEIEDANSVPQSEDKQKKKIKEPLRVAGEKGSLKSRATQIQEAIQDKDIKIHDLQKQIKAAGGEITDQTNPYEALNHSDSRAQAATERYSKHYIDPIADMIQRWSKKGISDYERVSDYLSAKHSIERDKSGVSALSRKKDGKWTLDETTKIVEGFEAAIGATEVAELWGAVRKATNELLDISFRSGRMSLDDKRDIVSHNWQYYVPLRDKDFDFEKIGDLREMFNYDRNTKGGGDAIAAGKKAKGRSSKAADPISMLIYMASSEIVRSEHNIALRHLLRLAERYPERSDLFAIKQKWYVKNDQGGWSEVSEQPPVEQIKASIKARRALQNEKDAQKRAELEAQITVARRDVKGDKTYNGDYDEKSHDVVVYKDGVRSVITIADIEVAQAINYRAGEWQSFISNTIGRPTRMLAQLSTSKNPAFVLPNFIRDIKNALQYHFVDSDGNTADFIYYALGSWKTMDRYLRGKAKPLTMAEIGEYDLLYQFDRRILKDKYGARVMDTMYEMFVANGGQTGYVHISDAKRTRRKLRKGIKTKTGHNIAKKGAKGLNTGLDYMANMSENAVRYATFIAQLDNGHSVFNAVSYAKNITVNFNRKGRYSKGIGASYMFFNASIQATVNQYSLLGNKQGRDKKTMTKQRLRFALAKAITLSLGYASQQLIVNALSNMAGDDGEEYAVSLYERLTNFLIPVSGKGYIKIPVAQSERPIYALGVMLGEVMDDKMTVSDMVGTFIQMFQNAYSPMGFDLDVKKDGPTALLKPIIPSSMRPFTDLMYNEDFAGRSIYKKSFSDNTPNSELGKENGLGWLQGATKWLNEVGGGNEVTPAGTNRDGSRNWLKALDLNPSQIEHILKGYTGGWGRMALDASSLILDEEKEVRRIPIANRFAGEAYEVNPAGEYWQNGDMIKRRDDDNRQTEARGIPSARYDRPDDNFKELATEDAKWRDRLRTSDKRIKQLKKEMERYDKSSDEFKQKKRDIKGIQRTFNNQYEQQYTNAQHD